LHLVDLHALMAPRPVLVSGGMQDPSWNWMASIGSVALNAFGSGNTVTALPGPLAIAGAIFQNGKTITKVGPGFNINGIVVGGAAAVHSAASRRIIKPAAAATRSTKASAAAASVGHKK
jgi:hypothetical protein